ncbi:MAG: hypothetical protein ACXADY_19010 [Candidatus Hodarchaeales archaeon]
MKTNRETTSVLLSFFLLSIAFSPFLLSSQIDAKVPRTGLLTIPDGRSFDFIQYPYVDSEVLG